MPPPDDLRKVQYLYLTTTGRKTGLLREIEIWFVASGGNLYVLAEHFHAAQWVRNILKAPRVRVRIGDRAYDATATVLDPGRDAAEWQAVQQLAREKYGWGEGLPVRITSRSMLSDVERGEQVPAVLVLDRIATGLGTTWRWMWKAIRCGRTGACGLGIGRDAMGTGDRTPPAERSPRGVSAGDPLAVEFRPETRSRWEWSPEEIRRVGHRVVDLIAEHLSTLPERPVFRPYPADLAAGLLDGPVPAVGVDASTILDEFAVRVEPYPFGNGHPRFYGWVNSPPAVIGVFADALAAAMDPSCAGGNHAAIYVERQVLNWFKSLLGFPPESMGLLVSGGSMATLTALAVARHVGAGASVRSEGLQRRTAPLTVYMGEEGHGCARKAVELLGIGSDYLRTIPSDGEYRMQAPALAAAIERDLAAGHRPLAVVASAGTVNTGAIDPLAEIAAVCRRHGLWLHVDGAYGAPAILTERYRAALEPIALADSVAVDPHKWFYIPVEAGLVLVRDAAAMRDAFSLVPPYLRTDGSLSGVGGPPWFSEFGFQQTRGFRALKVWMALKYHGLSGYAEAIGRDIALAGHLAARIAEAPDLKLAAPQSLSIVCFRYAPPALRGDGERLDAVNRAVLEEIQLGGQAFLSSTTLGGHFVLRACIVNPRASRRDIDALVDLVRAAGARLLERS